MLKSVLIFLVIAFFALIAENFFAGGSIWSLEQGSNDEDDHYRFVFFKSVRRFIKADGWRRIIIPALIVAIARYLMITFAGIAWLIWLLFAIFLLLAIFYFRWALRDGNRIRELIPFFPIFWVLWLQIEQIGMIIARTLNSEVFIAFFATIIPWAVAILPIILFIVFLWRKWYMTEMIAYKIIAIILAILLAIGSVCIVVSAFKGGAKSTVSGDSKSAAWYHFYNTDLQYDEDVTNNYNFGPNPYNEKWVAEDYSKDFRARLEKDPALGAADLAWLDANVGTRYLGEFYESCKGDWAKTINVAKVTFMKDQILYKKTLVAAFAFLDEGEVALMDSTSDITDQMYMNPFTVDAVPDVIVMKTDQQDGPFLVYTLKIKGNVKTVKYRIPCGYQPTNVEGVMHITPQTPPSGGTSGGENPTTTAKYNKDPSKSHNSGKNDDPGPGPSTNTGVGSTKSSAEKPSNSNNLSSYEEYKEKIKELEDANKKAPSSKPDSTTKVDDNGEEADAPAPESDKVSEIKGDSNAQAWDGPAD